MTGTLWRLCGFDDPEKDKICVWIVYEALNTYGITKGIRKSLAIYNKGKYRILETDPNDKERFKYGHNIMWSYVTDKPEIPNLIYDRHGWRITDIDPKEYLEE